MLVEYTSPPCNNILALPQIFIKNLRNISSQEQFCKFSRTIIMGLLLANFEFGIKSLKVKITRISFLHNVLKDERLSLMIFKRRYSDLISHDG